MKVALATAFTFFLMQLSTSAIAQQQDCHMEIREGSAARDLGRVLKCFDDRIKALEAKAGAGESRQGTGALGSPASEFDAGSFGISVRTATRTESNQINVLLNFRNKTTEDIHVAGSVESGEQIVLFDEKSGESSTGSVNGGLKLAGWGRGKEAFSTVPAGSTISVSLRFDGRKIAGSEGNLTLHLYQYLLSKHKPVTAALKVRIAS